jgi:hypothetical protein
MPIAIPAAIAAHIATTEAAMAPLNVHTYCATLDTLVPDAATLTVDERRGCFAEIQAHRFVLTTEADRGPWGIWFGPIGTKRMKDGSDLHGPDAKGIDRDMIEFWAARSDATPHPVLRARYADLSREMSILWNKEHPDDRIQIRRDLAQRAAQAYLNVVAGAFEMDGDDTWIHLERAAFLALLVGDNDLAAAAKAAIFAHGRARRGDGGGRWWEIDNLIARQPKLGITPDEDEELIAWIDEALEAYSNIGDRERFDPHMALDAAEALIRRRGTKGRSLGLAALRKAGDAFEAMAAKADGLLAGSWLQSMSQRYRLAGLVDDANRVDLMILTKAREASAWTSAALASARTAAARPQIEAQHCGEATVVVPQPPNPDADTDDFIIAKLTEKSGIDSLEKIARHLMAPEGHLRASEIASAERLAMPDLFQINKVGHDGFTTATIGPAGQDLAGRMVYFAAFYMAQRSPELDGALKAAVSKWSLDADAIVDFLGESQLFLPRLRGFLEVGVEAWFAGDDMKAIHILVPQVEAAVREMLIASGASPMKINDRDGGFQHFGMGTVLVHETLIKSMDPTLRLHLRSLYTAPKGHNLRNELAHGLATPSLYGRGLANWVIHSLLAIRVIGHASP